MKKPIVYIIVIVIIIILVNVIVFAFMKKDDSGSRSLGVPGVFKAPTEKEKYASYAAEISCEFLGMDFEDKDAMVKTVDRVQIIMQENGYTYSQTMELNEKYQNDTEFREIAYDETKRLCPDKLKAANVTEFSFINSDSSD